MTARACGGKNANGKPCGAPVLAGASPPRCWAHAGGKVAKLRAKARRKGGRSRMRQVERRKTASAAPPLKLRTRTDAVDVLARVAAEVYDGKLDARSAFAITSAVQAALKPGLLDSTDSFESFFAQFTRIDIDVSRNPEDDTPGAYGVLKDGTRVALPGVLELAAIARLRGDADVDLEFDINVPARAAPDVQLTIHRNRAPSVPPPTPEDALKARH